MLKIKKVLTTIALSTILHTSPYSMEFKTITTDSNTISTTSGNRLTTTLEESKIDFLKTLSNTTQDESPTFGETPRFFASGISLAVPYVGQYSNYSNSGSTVISWKNPMNINDHKFIVIQNLSWSPLGQSPWSLKTHAWLYSDANHETNASTTVEVAYYLSNTISSEHKPEVHIHPLAGGGNDSIMFSPNNFHLIGLPESDLEEGSLTIFQSVISHSSKVAATLHILMNTIDHEIYTNIMTSGDALQALDILIESSVLNPVNFNKLIEFLNYNIS